MSVFKCMCIIDFLDNQALPIRKLHIPLHFWLAISYMFVHYSQLHVSNQLVAMLIKVEVSICLLVIFTFNDIICKTIVKQVVWSRNTRWRFERIIDRRFTSFSVNNGGKDWIDTGLTKEQIRNQGPSRAHREKSVFFLSFLSVNLLFSKRARFSGGW